MRSAFALVVASLAIAAPELDAQSSPRGTSPAGEVPRQARAARTAQPPRIDGVLDDDAWRQAQPLTGLVQRAPEPGAPSTQGIGNRE